MRRNKQQILCHVQTVLIHVMIWISNPGHIPTPVTYVQEAIPSNAWISRGQTGQIRMNKFLWGGHTCTLPGWGCQSTQLYYRTKSPCWIRKSWSEQQPAGHLAFPIFCLLLVSPHLASPSLQKTSFRAKCVSSKATNIYIPPRKIAINF